MPQEQPTIDRDPSILVEIRNLKKRFLRTKGALFKRVVGVVKAVDGVDFFIKQGETLSLVGESGCGKTTTGRCVLRAIEPSSGEIYFRLHRGEDRLIDMMQLGNKALKQVRKHMSMIFQDPYSSLNPRKTIRETVGDFFIINRTYATRRELDDKVAELLRMVRLDPVYMSRYPHAFSGGQRQRIAIAQALALNPRFVVADEPVSALDVSVQAQITNLLEELQQEFDLTYLFIAHNLAVVKYVSDRIGVMYLGKIVELAAVEELFVDPKHPYTEALFSAVPKPDPRAKKMRAILEGEVADPANPPPGCHFHPRCRYAKAICRTQAPALANIRGEEEQSHRVACHFVQELDLLGITD